MSAGFGCDTKIFLIFNVPIFYPQLKQNTLSLPAFHAEKVHITYTFTSKNRGMISTVQRYKNK